MRFVVKRFLVFQSNSVDVRAWLAFLLGALTCIFALSYIEVQKEPSGLLVFDTTSTQPGMLKVFYTKDGQFTDPGWAINFPKGNVNQIANFPLSPGQYDSISFKPLVEAGGRVSIRSLRFISATGVSYVNVSSFVEINQLVKVSSSIGEVMIMPAQGANDPFGAVPNLHEAVSTKPLTLDILWSVAGKLAMLAVFLALMFGLCGSLPFVRGPPKELIPELGLPGLLGFLAAGLLILYLRNAHSILVPMLYAEDGTWSAELINLGFFEVLFNVRPDYFVFGNVLLLALAQLSNTLFFGHNLTYLPHFISLFSMLFYSVLAVAPIILLRGVLRIEARLLLWLLILLVPLGDSSYEVLGRLNNIGHALLFFVFCLLIWRHYFSQHASRKQIIATDITLFLCANTNPLCYPLIGIFFGIDAWQHWSSSGRPKLRFWVKQYLSAFSARSAVILLAMLFFMGLWILVRVSGETSPMAGKIVISNIPEMIAARTFLYPIIFPFYSHFNNGTSVVLLLIVIVVIVLLVKDIQRVKFTLISAAVVLAAGAAITIVSRPELTEILDHFRTTFPDRYYFGLTLFVYLVIASALSVGFNTDKYNWRRMGANTLAGGLVALYAGNGAFLFEFSDPRFSYLPKVTFLDEVKKSYAKGASEDTNDMGYKVAIHPTPVSIFLPEYYITATVLGVRSLPFSAYHESKESMQQLAAARARGYDGKVVRQKPAGRGREDGWFYVSGGVRSWIPDGNWLKQKKLLPEDVIEITSSEFAAIPDSGEAVK